MYRNHEHSMEPVRIVALLLLSPYSFWYIRCPPEALLMWLYYCGMYDYDYTEVEIIDKGLSVSKYFYFIIFITV